MVKWYNGCLPSNSRGFDYPWPHKNKNSKVYSLEFLFFAWVIEKAFELDYEFMK